MGDNKQKEKIAKKSLRIKLNLDTVDCFYLFCFNISIEIDINT